MKLVVHHAACALVSARSWVFFLLLLAATPVTASEPVRVLTLDQAIFLATSSDPWLSGSLLREDALLGEAVSVASLPDPKVSVRAANFPTDTFALGQEAMTQLSVGVSQRFPRGDSLRLASRYKRILAAQEPLLRRNRKAKITADITQVWLEAFSAQESIRLIEQDRSLFVNLVDATRADYSTAFRRARQQDVIRAQLELVRIDDRLTELRQSLESAQRRLTEWIGVQARLPIAEALPNRNAIPVEQLSLVANSQWVYEQIGRHPSVRALEQRIKAMHTDAELARQKYRPEWGLSTQYGYRGDDPMGRDRADLVSIGLTFDLPLFTANRQDREVKAAVSRAEALKTEKVLMTRRMVAELEAAVVRLRRLDERHARYDQQLLPQMADQAEAALAAYNNDDGDFAEAVRARIAELNAKIEALVIAVQRQKTQAVLNYLLSGRTDGAARPQPM